MPLHRKVIYMKLGSGAAGVFRSNIRTIRNPDLAIYLVHAAFYSVFLVRAFGNLRVRPTIGGAQPPRAGEERTASFSRGLIVFHGAGFALMYAGIGAVVFPRRVPEWFTGQRIAGAAVIAVAALLVVWALEIGRAHV